MNPTTTTSNQKNRSIGDLFRNNPQLFISKVLGDDPWDKQLEIINSVRDNRETSVRSCHGAGKSFIAARVALWFLCCFPNSIVLTTAPSFRQVEAILWRNIRSAYNKAKVNLGGEISRVSLNISPEWFALGLSTDEPDRFQGFHAEHILIIADEAAGIPETIFNAVDGVLTSGHSRLLMIGNPTSLEGRFYDSFKQIGVSKIHISAFDTPNVQKGEVLVPGLVTRDWVEDRKRVWGESSSLYISRVLGNFPPQEPDTLIPLNKIEGAIERELPAEGDKQIGIDIARYGSDKTVFVCRQGKKIIDLESFYHQDLMQTVGKAIQFMNKHGKPTTVIDAIGVGAGVVDRLLEQKFEVIGCNVAEKAEDDEHFANQRSEFYWGLRQRFADDDIDLPDDEQFLSELSKIKYKVNSRGQTLIESKEDIKKRGLPSPDYADALMLAFAPLTYNDIDVIII